VVQLLIQSRYTDVTDVIMGGAGGAIGWWIAARSARADTADASPLHASVRWLVAIAGYSLFLVAGFWFPFEITRDRALIVGRLHELFRVPFLALQQSVPLVALTQILLRLLLFAPLGAIWARVAHAAPSPARRWLLAVAGTLYCAVLAFGIEAGEVLMPSKTADSTEVVLCTVGAIIGLVVALRVMPAIESDQRAP
jgi:glycopeptide antibiotics resistance protein